MRTNVNTNKNTQNNSNHQSTKVVVNVQTASAPKRRRRTTSGAGAGTGGAPTVVAPVSSPTSIYYPHQSTSVPEMTPTPNPFQSASTNRDVALTAMTNAAENQRQAAEFHNAYTQASIPLGSVGLQTDTFAQEAVSPALSPTHSSVQEESTHVQSPPLHTTHDEPAGVSNVDMTPEEKEGSREALNKGRATFDPNAKKLEEHFNEQEEEGHEPDDEAHEPEPVYPKGTLDSILRLEPEQYTSNQAKIYHYAYQMKIPLHRSNGSKKPLNHLLANIRKEKVNYPDLE